MTRYYLDGRTYSIVCGPNATGSGSPPPGTPAAVRQAAGGCATTPSWFAPLPIEAMAPGAASASASARSLVLVAAALGALAVAAVGAVLLPLSTLCCRAGCALESSPGCAGRGAPNCGASALQPWADRVFNTAIGATFLSALALFIAVGVYDAAVTRVARDYVAERYDSVVGAGGAIAPGSVFVSVGAGDGYGLAMSAGVFFLVCALPLLAAAWSCAAGWLSEEDRPALALSSTDATAAGVEVAQQRLQQLHEQQQRQLREMQLEQERLQRELFSEQQRALAAAAAGAGAGAGAGTGTSAPPGQPRRAEEAEALYVPPNAAADGSTYAPLLQNL